MMPEFHSSEIPFALHPLGMLQILLDRGHTLEGLLNNSGITPADLAQKKFVISFAQIIQIVDNAQPGPNKHGLGLLLGAQMGWHHHGPVSNIIYSSPNLAEAYFSFRRYLQLAQPVYPLLLKSPDYYFDRDDNLVIQLPMASSQLLPPAFAVFDLEFRLAVLVRLFRACGNPDARDKRIKIGLEFSEPACPNDFQTLLDITPQFNTPHSYIAVHRDFFLTSWRELHRPLFEKIIDECEQQLEQVSGTVSLSEKLRWLMSHPGLHDLRLEKAASLLAISPRALARRLTDEGTSFRALQYALRAERARCHLRYSRLPQDDLAQILGFSCASSLRRAARLTDAHSVSVR